MKKVYLIALATILLVHQLHAQQSLTTDSALKKMRTEYPQEKVFLQTDKSQYVAGETIWMKAWCMLDGSPTYLSRILYIDMVNAKGKVVLKKMYKLDSLASTAADFDLSSNIEAGNYSINAYTLWGLNFPSFISSKNIYVYSPFSDAASKKKTATAPVLKLNFFPEGGDVVAGLNNRVAFKATDGNGFPININGNITNAAGKTVASFSSVHDGLGMLEMDIAENETYTANVPLGGGGVLQFKLPTVKPMGITLKIDNRNASRMFATVSRNEKSKDKFPKVKLVAQMNNQQFFTMDIDLSVDAQATIPLNKKNLPPGIAHITVFDMGNNPLTERIAFVSNYDIEQPAVKLDSVNVPKRKKNTVSFATETPMSALSVCVTDANLDQSAYNENIVSSFLLTSDLKGYIHNPAYYFKDKEPATLQHLDLLLMTQGWRRFEWKQILNNQFAALKYPVESAISIRGIVTKSDRDAVVKDGHVSFLIRGDDSTRIMADASITDKGEFLLSDLNYRKKAIISYQGTNSKKQALIVDVKLTPSFIDSLSMSGLLPSINLDTANLAAMKDEWAKYLYGKVKGIDTSNATYLGNVTVTAKRLSRPDSLNNEYATGPFMMGKGVDPTEYKYATTVWQMLQAAVPGIRVEGNFFDPVVSFTRYDGVTALSSNNQSSVNIGNSSSGESVDILTETNGIAYFLNEVNVSKDVINSLGVDDIALIKVLKVEAMALGASQGAIAFYTKKGVSARNSIYDKSYTNVERQGYAIVREFYVPESTTALQASNVVDNRYTVYWNGRIRPAKDGKYRFSFLNNNNATKFKLVIQGYDKDGGFIYKEQVIQ